MGAKHDRPPSDGRTGAARPRFRPSYGRSDGSSSNIMEMACRMRPAMRWGRAALRGHGGMTDCGTRGVAIRSKSARTRSNVRAAGPFEPRGAKCARKSRAGKERRNVCAGKRGDGGGRGIRTHEGRKALPVFKTGAFNRSASPPRGAIVTRNRATSVSPAQSLQRSIVPFVQE